MKVPQHIIVRYADDWEATSRHEIGHLLVGAWFGVLVSESWLVYQHTLFGWSVVGRTEVSSGAVDDNAAVRFVVGGLEAEAIWIAMRDSTSLDEARHYVYGRPLHQTGDVADLHKYLTTADITLSQAVQDADEILGQSWETVERLAERLRWTGSISVDELP